MRHHRRRAVPRQQISLVGYLGYDATKGLLHRRRVTAGQIGATDGASKQHVAGEHHCAGTGVGTVKHLAEIDSRKAEQNAASGVPGRFGHLKGELGNSLRPRFEVNNLVRRRPWLGIAGCD